MSFVQSIQNYRPNQPLCSGARSKGHEADHSPLIVEKLISCVIHPLSHICIHDMQKEWTITYLMHFKTSKMPEEGRSKCKIKVWGVNTKIFIWHLFIFYKSHHPVDIQTQETKQCATPRKLNSMTWTPLTHENSPVDILQGSIKLCYQSWQSFLKCMNCLKRKSYLNDQLTLHRT